MRLISNWRQALRMYSVQAQTVTLAGIGAWQVLPDEWRAAVPPSVMLGLAMGFLALGILGRLVAQPGIEVPNPAGGPD